MPLDFLSPEEVRQLTGRQRVTAQVKALDAMGIPYRRRPDGTVAVLRLAVETALGCGAITPPMEPEPQMHFQEDDGKVHPWDYVKGRKRRGS